MVIDPNPEWDIAGEAESVPTATPGPATTDGTPGADLANMEEKNEDDHAVPAVTEVLLLRSTKDNRGDPPIRMQNMLLMAMENGIDPQSYKMAIQLSDGSSKRGDTCQQVSKNTRRESWLEASYSRREWTTRNLTLPLTSILERCSLASLSTNPELPAPLFPQAASSVEQTPHSHNMRSTGWLSFPIAVRLTP